MPNYKYNPYNYWNYLSKIPSIDWSDKMPTKTSPVANSQVGTNRTQSNNYPTKTSPIYITDSNNPEPLGLSKTSTVYPLSPNYENYDWSNNPIFKNKILKKSAKNNIDSWDGWDNAPVSMTKYNNNPYGYNLGYASAQDTLDFYNPFGAKTTSANNPSEENVSTKKNTSKNTLDKIKSFFSKNKTAEDYSDGADSQGNQFDRNILSNKIKSLLQHVPTFDSIGQYFDKKNNTPDKSNFEIAKQEAMKPTEVSRQSANHISGNYKSNIYDITLDSNIANSQNANALNILSRLSKGNMNALNPILSNINSNSAINMGKQNLNAWKENENHKQNNYALNQQAEQFNAQADNAADQNYISAKNNAAQRDHENRINALNSYATNIDNIDHRYQQELDDKRNNMIENIANEGLNAYNKNKTNTNGKYNYWYDDYGIMHYKDGTPTQNTDELNISDEVFENMLAEASDDDKIEYEELSKKYTPAIARQIITNSWNLRNKNHA